MSRQTGSDLKPMVKPDLNYKGSMPIVPSVASFTCNRTQRDNLSKGSDFNLVKCSYLKWNIFEGNTWAGIAFTIQILGINTVYQRTFF